MSKYLTPNKLSFNKIIKKNFSLDYGQIEQYLKYQLKIVNPKKKIRSRDISNLSNDNSKNSQIFDKNYAPNSNDSIIKISDIYKLPKIERNQESPIRIFNAEEIEKNKKTSLQKNLSENIENNYKIKIKEKEDEQINRILKNKFYIDTENRMNKKLYNKKFNFDSSMKNRIIEINKVREFWGGFLNYCNPVLSNKKFACIKKNFEKKYKIIKKENKLPKINRIKSPRLYTLNSVVEYNLMKKKENESEIKEKICETE